MVKWKKMNKKMAGLLLGVMMLFTASTTAFAYVDESAEASKVETIQTEQSTDKEEKKDENESEEGYFTETLAKIYIKQGRYSKALEIIKRLNLNYPKKNAYFADQIRFLEKLIINNKNKK